MLAEHNVKQGHEVLYISDCLHFSDGKLIKASPGKTKLKNDIILLRIPFVYFFNNKITTKIGKVKGLLRIIEEFKPDVVFHHGAVGFEMLTVLRYIKKNQNIIFYVDSHSDYNNGAKTKLQRLIYKYILSLPFKISYKYIDRVFYLTSETKDFLVDLFNAKDDKLDYLPLGGIITSELDIASHRDSVIRELNLSEDTIIAIHSGKLTVKKRTLEMMRAFSKINNNKIRFLIIGSIDDSIQSEFEILLRNDSRILYLGWKDSTDLRRYLDAADIYVQLGTQSATMQNAACSGCALALYPYKSHIELFGNSVFYISSEKDVEHLFMDIANNREILEEKAKDSFTIAKSKLDYQMLARKISCKIDE